MKRDKFIASIVAIASTPLQAFAWLNGRFARGTNGFKVDAGQGRIHGHLTLKGVNANVLDVKISGGDTDGDLALFEQTSLSPGRGTPLHVHPNQDEVFYVLDGSYRFKVGDDLFDLAKGDSIFLPRKVPHAWIQDSDQGKMMVILQPAGKLENFFVSMAGLDHEPGQEEVAKLFSVSDMQVIGPPLPKK